MNSSNNTTGLELTPIGSSYYSQGHEIAIPVVYGIECVLGLVGNLVVMVTLARTGIDSIPKIFIFNLATSDLMFVTVLPFLAYTFVTEDWVLGTAVCKLALSLDGLNQFSGVFFLTVMSVDRYVTLVHSMRAMRYRSLRGARVVCIAVWALALVATVPIALSATVVTYEDSETRLCTATDISPTFDTRSLIVYAFVVGFLVPITAISACYLLILFHVSRNRHVVSKSCSRKMSRRLAKIVLVYFSVFVVCWLPFYTVQFVTTVSMETDTPQPWFYNFYLGTICLAYANGVLNPFVYTFSGKVFRQQVRHTFNPPRHKVKNRLQSQYIVLKPKQFNSSETTNSNCL